MNIQIGGITFDNGEYDERGDVLYLNVGLPRPPAETHATPEGHAVDYDASGNVIGLTLVSPRQILERDGELALTWPQARLTAEQLSAALTPA